MSEVTPGRPLVEPAPASRAPGGRSAPTADRAREREVRALAELLAWVVEMAGCTANFPGHWEQIAEQAMEHPSVRAALAAAEADS